MSSFKALCSHAGLWGPTLSFLLGCGVNGAPGEHESVLLTIDLQEGFSGDETQIYVDDLLVFQDDEVVSHPVVGIAGSVEVEVSSPSVQLRVELPARELVFEETILINRGRWVGLSLQNGKLQLHQSEQPFGYS